jgi:HK97 family phage major capsid protein
MNINERVSALSETRARVWNEAANWLQDLPKGEEMSAEQRVQWDRYNERIDGLASEIDSLVATETREREAGALREAQGIAFGVEPDTKTESRNLNAELRSWIRGETRSEAVDHDGRRVNGIYTNINAVERERNLIRQGASAEEIRALAWDTGSVASAVPTLLDRSIYTVLEETIAAFRMPTTRLSTDSGAPMDFPKITTNSIATQVAGQGTTLAGTDPVFGKLTLTPVKYGELIKVASEVVTDSGVDIVSIVGSQIGRAVGRRVNEAIIADIVATAFTGSAGTVSTGGTLIDPTFGHLVDLEFSVNDAYRQSSGAGWLLRDKTAGVLRKIRDGAGGTEGSPIWQTAVTNGITGGRGPDSLFGYPVFTDPGVASLASNAKVLFFGDWNSYYFRTVGNLMVERSDEAGFSTDEVFFRGKWRADGGAADLTAINLLKRSV